MRAAPDPAGRRRVSDAPLPPPPPPPGSTAGGAACGDKPPSPCLKGKSRDGDRGHMRARHNTAPVCGFVDVVNPKVRVNSQNVRLYIKPVC